jgi:sugar phosphate isomerase/epimerase
MNKTNSLSRRSFLAASATSAVVPLVARLPVFAAAGKIPVGLELFSVRNDLKEDEPGTVRKVAALGYQCVEFYAPYFSWTVDYAKQMRAELDELKIRCYSTHNGFDSFSEANIGKAIELNKILGARFVVLASAGSLKTADEWKNVADRLNTANQTLAKEGLHAGYHNHQLEWKPVEGKVPLEILASNTDKSIMLQLDVGTCVEAGADPVAWINGHPGRIRSLHLKEWSPDTGYKALFGEGVAPWQKIFAAAENGGGVEYYLIEQEGSRFPEIETAQRCLAAYRKSRGLA